MASRDERQRRSLTAVEASAARKARREARRREAGDEARADSRRWDCSTCGKRNEHDAARCVTCARDPPPPPTRSERAAARRPPPVGCSLTHEACALPGPPFPFLTNNEKSPENELNLKTLAPPRSAATV